MLKIFFTLFFILIIFTLSSKADDYLPEIAIKYAKKWFNGRNPKYNNYELDQTEDVNFVSQCLFEGGISFSGCKGRDDKGMIIRLTALQDCLKDKGWRESKDLNSNFKKGNPIILAGDRHIMLATDIEGNNIHFCGHMDDTCNVLPEEKLIFYFKDNYLKLK